MQNRPTSGSIAETERTAAALRVADLLLRSPKADVVARLVQEGYAKETATILVEAVDAQLAREHNRHDVSLSRFISLIDGAISTRHWRMTVFFAVVLLIAYSNFVSFEAGLDGCRWGEPTDSQCGVQLVGTSKGRAVGTILYGPGYVLGRAASAI